MTQESFQIQKAGVQSGKRDIADLIFEDPIDKMYRWLLEPAEMEYTSAASPGGIPVLNTFLGFFK